MSLSREDQALAGEFVLGLADPAERRRLERRIERDPEFAAAVQAWQRHFSGLDATATPVTPSPDLWTRIEASRQAQGRPRLAEPPRSRWADLWNSLALGVRQGLPARWLRWFSALRCCCGWRLGRKRRNS